ncbi:MAG: hypothetical protein CEN87_661 [Parcubacteria group bacterium Licking1014_1]|nr:MAG: hypothetical protein CEN87_661 [Parcubacteria group bacterium Licking1014_1]
MELKEIINKNEWEGFLETCAEKTFLQSWNWGEFNKLMKNKIWRFGIYNQKKLIGAALVSKIKSRRGTFLFIPHGPVIMAGLVPKDKKEIFELLLVRLKEIAKELACAGREKASFIRISPILERNEDSRVIFKELNFREAPIHIHPEITWQMDIASSEENLLMNMRKTTRYLIRQAEKNPDIQIIKSNKIKDLELFFPVYVETAKRHRFVIFPKEYLEAQFNSFSEDGEICLFLGKYKNEIVSAAIFVFWQDICFYHHSGSVSKYNKIPVSYLLQWEAIKEAKNRGCKNYNFWGIAPFFVDTKNGNSKSKTQNPNKKHPWWGLTLFKMGFGGHKKEYIKTQDYIISQKYWFNYIIEKTRKFKRNL